MFALWLDKNLLNHPFQSAVLSVPGADIANLPRRAQEFSDAWGDVELNRPGLTWPDNRAVLLRSDRSPGCQRKESFDQRDFNHAEKEVIMGKPTFNIYQHVTDAILAELKAGSVPWSGDGAGRGGLDVRTGR